ncbi:MAG: UPF0182 family protein [Geobacteraceae bacterium]|nr:UPF0182 family protein [Geobacteraceae bacterium]
MSGRKKFYLLALAIVVVLPGVLSLVHLYTDWLFFLETGFSSVFSTILGTKIGVGVAGGAVLLACALANLFIVFRARFPLTGFALHGQNLNQLRLSELQRLAKPLSMAGAAVLAFFAGQWAALHWQTVLLFANSLPVGVRDPVMDKDLGFYLFHLPLLEVVRSFAGFVLASSAVLVGAAYYLRGGVTLSERGVSVSRQVKTHLAVLAGLFLLVVGFGFYLETFRLLLSGEGTVHGAGYADVNARIPLLQALVFLTVLAAPVLVFGVWKGRPRVAVAAPAAVALLYGAGVVLYPALLQKFKVAPNELALETPYLANNIKFTRFGYDLDSVETIPFDVTYNLSAADIEANDATIRNIRLWDHAPLLRTYSQLQQIRTYYKFFDVDNDRYTVNGRYTQVMLSPRELSYSDLPSKSWINERLIFTHGNGLAFGPVSRISKEGLPEFFVKDIPAVSLADIRVARPEIYYGEMSNDYVIVRTRVPEFSYPTATGNINTTYAGKGGVVLDSLLRKILFSARFRTEKILLSSDITEKSRILYYRSVGDRVRTVAPFLRYDGDPYMVVSDDGRLKWIVDAYTFTDRLPYSKPLQGGINYLRNSVKVVVDAYDGSLDFYLNDPGDILAKVYGRAFPELFKPLSAMPGDLRGHIRYPHQFLRTQAAMYSAYHMTDPKVFYNKENLWEVPAVGDQPMEPYYTVMKLPGEEKEEYILLLPFTPSKRDNLAAWLTARCDGANYGKLRAYTFPRDRLIYGPKQVDARINQDSYISQQLTLWNQRGSQVIRGSMLVIPIEKSLLYVQPLYLAAADKSGLPELRRVIVAYGDEVVMEENLDLALQRIFGSRKPKAAEPAVFRPAGENDVRVSPLAREAMEAFDRAVSLQRQGDWAGYGEELRKLRDILQRMAK